jgi:hypothetical protein
VDRETKKRLYNACNPDEPLGPEDPRNVDVDAIDAPLPTGARPMIPGPRGAPWAEGIASRIELSDRPVMELVTATRGVGLTTELRRLASRLSSPEGAHLLSVLVDGAAVMSLAEPIDVPDLLLPLVEATAGAVVAAGGARQARDGTIGDLLASGSWWSMSRDGPTARAKVRERVSAELSRFVAEVRDELTLLHGQARGLGYGGIVVLFDSLTRLQGYSANWAEVLESAERTFGLYASYLELPVHVVYTVPPSMTVRLGAPIRFLPAIALRDRQGSTTFAGHVAMASVLQHRVGGYTSMLLGSAPRIADPAPTLMVASGGVLRDLLRLLQAVIVRGSPDTLTREISTTLEGYRRLLWESDLAWLARVHRIGTLSITNAEERDAAERLLAHGTVLRYATDVDWFDVHPAVLPLLDPTAARA